jgi:hypothetical protein
VIYTARDLAVTVDGRRVDHEPTAIAFTRGVGDPLPEYDPFVWHGTWRFTGHRGLCRCEDEHDCRELGRRHRTRARLRRAERRACIQRARKRDAEFRRRVAAYPDDLPF